MNATHYHHGFGVDFVSAIPIPELHAGSADHAQPVTIRLASAPCPKKLTQIAPGVAAGPQDFWMEVPDGARIHVAGGSSIAIDPEPGASMDDIRAYLLGSAMGALLHQRGLLPLHASAVEIDGQAIAFCGASGAGKSSLALYLVRRGHRLLCDDICAIDTASGVPTLWPGLINLKLWGESLAAAGEAVDGLEPVLVDLDKYKLPSSESGDYRSYPLGQVFLLAVSEQPKPETSKLTGVEGLSALVANTFRGQLVQPMGLNRRHFGHCTAVGTTATIHRLSRPWSLAQMDATCDAVEAAIRTS
jgi:HPr Serine kinase C-terminal domain